MRTNTSNDNITDKDVARMHQIEDWLVEQGLDASGLERLEYVAAELAGIDEKIADLVAYRDELIRRAHRQGASLREIAKVAGISHVAVANKLKK